MYLFLTQTVLETDVLLPKLEAREYVNERHIDRLRSTHSIYPVLPFLTKAHKFPHNIPISNPEKIKPRPNPDISGCGGPADKALWLMQKICKPLLQSGA